MIMNCKYTKKNVGANNDLPLTLISVRFQLRLLCHFGLNRDDIHV